MPGPNYAGGVNGWDQGRVDVYWKGKAPDYVYALVPKAKAEGIELAIHEDAKYSAIELMNAVERLDKSDLVKKYGITGFSVNHDGASIKLDFRAAAPNPFPLDEFRKIARVDCEFTLEENVGDYILQSS